MTALEDLLDGWAGTLIAASHDRYFLERVCDDVTALIGGGATRIAARWGRRISGAETPRRSSNRLPLMHGRWVRPRLRAISARRARTSSGSNVSWRSSRNSEAALHAKLAAAATDYVATAALDADLQSLLAARAQLEEDWLAAAHRADS